MERVVVLGPGGAGKSTFARALGEATGLPVVELDKHFWTSDLEPTPPDEWTARQEEICAARRWILDGDLGPHDVLPARLVRADTVVVFDLPTWRCLWRAARRSRERADFWRWVLTWRRRHRPGVMAGIAEHAAHAELLVIRRSADGDALLERERAQGEL